MRERDVTMRMRNREQKQKKKYLIALEETRSIVALAAGILVFICTLLCVFWAINVFDAGMLQYFTLLSNLLSAVAAAFMIPYAVEGIRKKRFVLPRWVVLFQFAGAVCVTITMVIALGLILPTRGARQAFDRFNLWLHVVTPLATVVLFLCVESGVSLTKRDMLLAQIPYWAYMLVYLIMVSLLGRWKDIYSVTVFMPIWATIPFVLAVGMAVAVVLRRVQNRRTAQSWNRIARMWSDDLEPTQLLIEAFGLGRYIGAVCDPGELTVPLDIFKAMAERYDVPLEKLTKAYVKGALDAVEEKTKKDIVF